MAANASSREGLAKAAIKAKKGIANIKTPYSPRRQLSTPACRKPTVQFHPFAALMRGEQADHRRRH
jgi:hypothetical protein